jgi:cellobiose phosphorylase
MHETLLGLDRRGDTLRFDPRVPPGWDGFSVRYRHGRAAYAITFARDPEFRGAPRVTLDGAPLPGGELALADDGLEHAVEVRFGPPGGGP